MLDDLYGLLVDKYNEVTIKSGDLLTYLGISIETLSDERFKISQPVSIEKILETEKV